MTYDIISTGSQGNAVVINGMILIDCGVPFVKLDNIYREFKLVLLTHIHSDHFNPSTIRRMAKERPTLRFACCEWMVLPLIRCGVERTNIDVLEIGKRYDYRKFIVSPIKLYHDVPNAGYRVFFGNERMIYATDTSTLAGIMAKNYDLYLLEANYETEKLIKDWNDKSRNGEFAYERRVMQSHLSKEECDEFIRQNAGIHSRYVYLHQHKYGSGGNVNDNNGRDYSL